LKLLLDSCIQPGAKAALERAGHEVEWVGDWTGDPGDDAILAHAARNRQVIVTLDKDFGELAVVFDAPHAGILRLVDFRSSQQASVCLRVIEAHTRVGERRNHHSGARAHAHPPAGRIRGRRLIREPGTEGAAPNPIRREDS